MFVASFNLPLPFVFDILFVGDKPADVIIKRKETTGKGERKGTMRRGRMTEGWLALRLVIKLGIAIQPALSSV